MALLDSFAGNVAERLACLVGLLALAPLFITIASAIVAIGERPIFAQIRVGKNETPFRIYKFRTIPTGGWPDGFDGIKAIDWRLRWFARLSAVLRVTGADEFPQLLNAIRGDMRLIGPRPLTPEDYAELPDGRRHRCAVAPGITGLAQVHGGQALGSQAKLALDLYFLEHRNGAMYGRILLRTLARLIGLHALRERKLHAPRVPSAVRLSPSAVWRSGAEPTERTGDRTGAG